MTLRIQAAAISLVLVFGVGLGHLASASEKVFDPSRDPGKDLLAAEAQAKAENKNILLDVGGNWCPWCIILDRTLQEDVKLKTAVVSNYVLVHVNVSTDNSNQEFLSKFPRVNGYPYLFVLSSSGKLLQAQPTDPFETDHKLNGGYINATILDFLNRWRLQGQVLAHD
jgi:thiol:disulfide interchange protein